LEGARVVPKDTLSPGLKQFLDQLRQQPPEHMQSHIQRAWRHWQKQVEEAVGPGWRKDPEWAGADQRWREHLDQQPATKTAQLLVPKRKHPGGKGPILTEQEIELLRGAYDAAQAKQKRPQVIVFKELRRLLPKRKQSISDRTLRFYIITQRQ
jgi:hypothetical protein